MKIEKTERSVNTEWRVKSLKPLLLMLVPVFFFFVFFVMAKKSKQDAYKKLGYFFGALSIVSLVLVLLGTLYYPLFYCVTLHIGAWVLCLMRAIKLRKRYQQYLEWAQEDEDQERNALVFDEQWRRLNGLWRIWSCIPLLGGLGTYYAARKIGNRALKLFSVCWVIYGLAIFVAVNMLMIAQVDMTLFVMSAAIFLIYPCICVPPLVTGLFYEDYLNAAAQMNAADMAEYPVMQSVGWRIKNSLWQALTFVPYIGTMGLFFVGIHRNNGKVLLWASVLCLSEMACIAGPSFLLGLAPLQGLPMLSGIAGLLGMLWFFVYIMVIYYGTLIRYDMLWERAYDLENN